MVALLPHSGVLSGGELRKSFNSFLFPIVDAPHALGDAYRNPDTIDTHKSPNNTTSNLSRTP